MKKIILILLLICAEIVASQCPNNITYFRTQKEIDDFKVNYPNCKNLNKDITIYGTTDNNKIKNLEGLSNLETISNIEFFYFSSDLITNNYTSNISLLDRFNSLQNINGSFFITENKSLTSISVPENLINIGNHLSIKNNNNLSLLNGFDSLENINGNFEISRNFNLENIPDFNKLKTIRQNLFFSSNAIKTINGFNELVFLGGEFNLQSSPSLIEISGFNNLLELNNNFMVNGAQNLTSLVGFTQLKNINGDFFISSIATVNFNSFNNLINTKSLTITSAKDVNNNFTGFNSIKTIGGYGLNIASINSNEFNAFSNIETSTRITIVNNSFSIISPLNNLKEIQGELSIYSNANLKDIDFLPNLETVEGLVAIHINEGLKKISGLNKLSNIDGNIYIQGNLNLETFSGFNNLIQTEKEIRFYQNPKLHTIDGFENLEIIQNEDLVVLENPLLQNIYGFNNLKTIEGILWIMDNNQLINIKGFTNLEHIGNEFGIIHSNLEDLESLKKINYIGGGIVIQYNTNLKNLNGLANVTSKTAHINLDDNLILENISGLTNIESIENYLVITDNPQLSLCEINPVCSYLELNNPSTNFIDNIDDNKVGCNSINQIINQCSILNTIDNNLFGFNFYPNPVNNKIYFTNVKDLSSILYIKIYDNLGKKLISKELNPSKKMEIDLRRLKQGFYYIQVTNKNKKILLKFIKE